MASSSVIDKDKGYASVIRKTIGDRYRLQVGVLGEQAAKQHNGGSDFGMITIGTLSEIHEFGLGNVPERSWLRAYVDGNIDRIRKMISRVAREVLFGRMTPEQGLNLVGIQIVGEIKSRITQGIAPALAASTIKRKGSSVPLIDTGQLLGSITHRVIS